MCDVIISSYLNDLVTDLLSSRGRVASFVVLSIRPTNKKPKRNECVLVLVLYLRVMVTL
jgi:hypothetical protein